MPQQKDLDKGRCSSTEPGSSQNPAVARFTAGPWFVTTDPPVNDAWYPGRTIGSETEGTRICDLPSLRSKAGNAANAALIVAAPDMYAALDFIFEHIADKERHPRDLYPAFGLDARRVLEMAQAALAKARGEV